MKVLVVSPHPDDEVLGAGGTIARLVNEGNDVTVVVVTKGWEPLFKNCQVEKVRNEACRAGEILGVKSVRFMDLPVTKLNEIPKHEINKIFDEVITQEMPEMVFLPFRGDRHQDHKEIFDACMVALRPTENRKYIKQILCYETVSETHWAAPKIEVGFEPQLWIDITAYLPTKLEAMSSYESQLREKPDARSLDAISSLAKWRGSVVGMHAAECFVVVRECWAAL